MNKKVTRVSFLVVSVFIMSGYVFAQVSPDQVPVVPEVPIVITASAEVTSAFVPSSSTSGACVILQNNNLRYKSVDTLSNGEVTILQKFLIDKSLLTSASTGYFGNATTNAVKQFQKINDISPTGSVGPLTRLKIKELSCGNVVSSNTSNVIQSVSNSNSVTTGSFSKTQEPTPVTNSNIREILPPLTPKMKNICGQAGAACDTAAAGKVEGKFHVLPDVTSISSGLTKSAGCSTESRLCPNGSVMTRNLTTCEWLVASCASVINVTATSVQTSGEKTIKLATPPAPVSVPSQVKNQLNVINQAPAPSMPTDMKISVSAKPIAFCTMEMRLCPNGMPMPRSSDCVWHADKCSMASSINNTIPQATVPAQ